LNHSKEEFLKSCPKEISSLWKLHVKFNGWKFKKDDENNAKDGVIYKKMNIEDIPFL
jgi:hypothetical protein